LSAYLIQVAAILKKTMQLIVEAHSIAEGRLQK